MTTAQLLKILKTLNEKDAIILLDGIIKAFKSLKKEKEKLWI